MQKLMNLVLIILSGFFLLLSISFFILLINNNISLVPPIILDRKFAVDFSTILQGFVGTTAGIGSSLLIVVVFLGQSKQVKISQLENMYFKMLDFHRENISNINLTDYAQKKKDPFIGKQAFVNMKLQLFDCLKMVEDINKNRSLNLQKRQIIDIAYMVFYYGMSPKWNSFSHKIFHSYQDNLVDVLQDHIDDIEALENKKIGRTNQTILGDYYRNMYNAIMLINSSKILSNKQKGQYVKILRAQLSNSEQALLYFNVMSRFGKKWNKNKLIEKYELIKNLPDEYCGVNYNHKEDFKKIIYEDDEIIGESDT